MRPHVVVALSGHVRIRAWSCLALRHGDSEALFHVDFFSHSRASPIPFFEDAVVVVVADEFLATPALVVAGKSRDLGGCASTVVGEEDLLE